MKKTILILISLACAACGSAPVQDSVYLLRHPGSLSDVAATSAVPLTLSRVEVAPYLDQAGIVLETAPNEVHNAQHHRWAEPLADSVRRYLQVAVGLAANTRVAASLAGPGEAATQIDVIIHQLHGGAGGDVGLAAEWRLINNTGAVLRHEEFTATTTVQTDGYAALVTAHYALLDRLAETIAAAVTAANDKSSGANE